MGQNETMAATETCDIYFNITGPCVYNSIVVKLGVEKKSSDEKILKSLDVVNQGNKFFLNITKDTSMLEGDRGYILFSDINFDGVPDIALTTSFGLANLYLDYWVFNTAKKQYIYIGNFAELKIDTKHKTLNNVVKINAAKYENNTYVWQGNNLVKKVVSRQTN